MLDLFCGAGGVSKGYALAGFDVVGVDIEAQPNYPFQFIQANAMTFPLEGFDAYHASPPCQGYSNLRHVSGSEHPLWIAPMRERLRQTGAPYVIENVESAKWDMQNPIKLCGSAFHLRVRRHRLFESNVKLEALSCAHKWQDDSPIYRMRKSKGRGEIRKTGVIGVHGTRQLHPDYLYGSETELSLVSEAMGIFWMNKEEINQAIPPAYTAYIGKQLLNFIEN